MAGGSGLSAERHRSSHGSRAVSREVSSGATDSVTVQLHRSPVPGMPPAAEALDPADRLCPRPVVAEIHPRARCLGSHAAHAIGAADSHLSRTPGTGTRARDRKSTRLNSSHGYISYAVFCLK